MMLIILATLVAAFIWAKLEIEIEGKDGWAKNLPTWRIENHFLLNWLMNGRPMTGYHAWAFTYIFFMFHVPAFWVGHWSWGLEARAVACVLFFWVAEDFLWFMLNPHFGWTKYRAQQIWWHRRWILGLPADHWGMIITSGLLFAISRR